MPTQTITHKSKEELLSTWVSLKKLNTRPNVSLTLKAVPSSMMVGSWERQMSTARSHACLETQTDINISVVLLQTVLKHFLFGLVLHIGVFFFWTPCFFVLFTLFLFRLGFLFGSSIRAHSPLYIPSPRSRGGQRGAFNPFLNTSALSWSSYLIHGVM